MTADPTTLGRNDKLTLADEIMRLHEVRYYPSPMMTVSYLSAS